MHRCGCCNGIIIAMKNCAVCDARFPQTNHGQILCGRRVCVKIRKLEKQSTWQKNNNEVLKKTALAGIYIKCVICHAEVKKVHQGQVTCQTDECRKKRSYNKNRYLIPKEIRKDIILNK